jgi:hypothetical protein
MIDEALARNPNDDGARAQLPLLLAREGKHAQAEALLRPVSDAQRINRGFHHIAYSRACVYALGAKAERAVEWLHATVGAGMPNYPVFSRDPCFDPIRRSPAFVQFMAELAPVWNGYEARMR